jgi:transposase
MTMIGEDVSERLDVIPARFRVLVTRRPKYACRRCSGAVVQAHAPEHVVPGGLPTEALIAQVIVAKFGDHLPFYRQAEIYARQGVILDRATLGNWAGRACFHLQPIADHMSKHLASADRVFMDETTAPVLDPGRRRTKKGFFWAIASDDRGHGGTGPPVVLFRYAPGRGGERFLRGYRGRYLQCDGYDGYEILTRMKRDEGPWTLVHCWSHLRRRFVKLLWSALADRLAVCKLVLHPVKTKIVYCKDANRRGDFPITSFDFLGFQFRARKTMWNGKAAHGFMPAAGPKALTAISRTVRRWSLHHRSDKSLQELAEKYNPCIRATRSSVGAAFAWEIRRRRPPPARASIVSRRRGRAPPHRGWRLEQAFAPPPAKGPLRRLFFE